MASNFEPKAAPRQDRAAQFSNSTPAKIPFPYTPLPVTAIESLTSGAISANAYALLGVLTQFRNGGTAWASNQVLAEKLRCSRSTVARASAELVSAGFVEKLDVPCPDPEDKRNWTGRRWVLKLFGDCPKMTIPMRTSEHPPLSPVKTAPLSLVKTNQEVLGSRESKQESIDQIEGSTSLSTSESKTEDAEAEPRAKLADEAFCKSLEIANEWESPKTVQFLERQQRKIKAEIGSENDHDACIGAVKAVLLAENKGTIRSHSGYFWKTFPQYQREGVPDNIWNAESERSRKAKEDKAWEEALAMHASNPHKRTAPASQAPPPVDATAETTRRIQEHSRFIVTTLHSLGLKESDRIIAHPLRAGVSCQIPQITAMGSESRLMELYAIQAKNFGITPEEVKKRWDETIASLASKYAQQAKDEAIMAKMPPEYGYDHEKTNEYRKANGLEPWPDFRKMGWRAALNRKSQPTAAAV